MGIKTALVDGPITPDLRTRLESMGFEIVDMNDSEAMKDLRRTLETQLVMRKVHDACGMPMIDIQQALRSAEAEFEAQEDQKHPFPTERHRELLPFLLKTIENTVEPMPEVRIDKKKDNSKFFDFKYGRGRARNQQFGKHFKHP